MFTTLIVLALHFSPLPPAHHVGPFDYAPMVDTSRSLGGTYAVPIIGEAPGIDRRCMAGERSACSDICHANGGQLAGFQMVGCRVGSQDGKVTMFCSCGQPALRASLATATDGGVE